MVSHTMSYPKTLYGNCCCKSLGGCDKLRRAEERAKRMSGRNLELDAALMDEKRAGNVLRNDKQALKDENDGLRNVINNLKLTNKALSEERDRLIEELKKVKVERDLMANIEELKKAKAERDLMAKHPMHVVHDREPTVVMTAYLDRVIIARGRDIFEAGYDERIDCTTVRQIGRV